MTQTKRKTLIFIGIAVLLLCFVTSVVLQGAGSSETVAEAATVTDATARLNSIMSNGKAPANLSTDGTRITNAEQLRNFLVSGSGKGYLANNITDFSWDSGKFTRRLMSENMTEFNGNGYTITLTATAVADTCSSPALGVADGDDKTDLPNAVERTLLADQALYTYAGTKNTRSNIDLHGGLIGYLRPNQTIRNCNFVYNKTIDISYKTRNCATFGLIAAYSLGIIDNCSLTVGGSISFFKDTNWTGSVSSYSQETMSKHSFALGGYVGTLSTNGRISNSKLVLNGNLTATVQGQNEGGTGKGSYRSNYARTWAGGVVGWMANSSEVFNMLIEGSGNLDARAVNPQSSRTLSYSGIVAGVSGGDKNGGEDSLIGLINNYGRIDGVINKWTGKASFLTENTMYSATNSKETSIPYLVVGVAGLDGDPNETVTNIYMDRDVYSGSTYSISHDYSCPKGSNGVNNGSYTHTKVFMQDVLGQIDGSESYQTASSTHAYITFGGTEISSPLLAVYDLAGVDGILWSKSINNTTTGSTNLTYYYDQATSIEDAKKFDVTYTEIPKDQNQDYIIRYTHGKAVYFTKSYPSGSDTSNPNKVVMPSIRYGATLSAPSLNLYYDKAHTQKITTLEDKSYWVSISGSNNVPIRMTDSIVSPDTYESFLYLDSPTGRDYSYIQFINTTFRYVSYIYDDPTFQAYKEEHPDYEPVRDGEKQIDWQQRAVQKVEPKLASIDWNYPSDITKVGDMQNDVMGNITSYGSFTTPYDGDPVVFDLTVPSGTLLSGDICGANYEYRMLDNYTQEYYKVDSCVNAGTYKLVVTSLTNSNYSLAGIGTVDYCIDFVIEQRQIGFINKIDAQLQGGDTYYIQVPYEARDIALADEIEIYPNQSQANSSRARIVLYNVLNKDRNILKFDYLAVDEGELNMRNVGRFEMRISLLGGIASSNYILPDVTKYLVEITEADAVLSTQTNFQYPYGFLVKDKVAPFVTVTGVDGMELTFDGFTYYQKIDGNFVEVDAEPFDAGEYRIKYDFLNAAYSNYKDASITINVTINKRQVSTTYTDNNNQMLTVPYGTAVDRVAVNFQRQSGENGIISYEYNSSIPVFSFIKLNDMHLPTDTVVDKAVDAGEYLLKVELDFKVGTTSTGWQINENTKDNYEVLYDYYSIIIEKRTVNININEISRSYGDDLPALNGESYALDEIRAWSYATADDFFLAGDNIVLLPVLSNTDIFAQIGEYAVNIPVDLAHMTDAEHFNNPSLEDYNKIDNYIVNIVNDGADLYKVTPRVVKVKVFLNTGSVIYGDALPEFLEARVISTKNFFESDAIELVADWQGVEVGSPVDTYYVSVNINLPNDNAGNYQLEVEEAEFTITPKTITIVSAELGEGEMTFEYNGTVHKPVVHAVFAEELVSGDVIECDYNYFEIVDGIMSTEATENPQYAGTYRVFIADASNPNYTIVFGDEYERLEIYMTITRREVKIDVSSAYRIYGMVESLTAEGYDLYSYADDTQKTFAESNTYLSPTLYTDQLFDNLDMSQGEVLMQGAVKIRFDGLEKDASGVDENGDLILEEEKDGNDQPTGRLIATYRNYLITMSLGDLTIMSGDLSDSNVNDYINLRNTESTYSGNDQYENFRITAANQYILGALNFRIFSYVAASSLGKAEADSSAAAYGKYTREEVDGKYVYTLNNTDGTYVRKYLRRVENGDSVDDKLVNAGQYFKHITPVAGNEIFTGEYITEFYIDKAERTVSADDVNITVNYNRISISSSISGMEVSFNGAAYVNRTTFVDLTPNTAYNVKVRFAQTANYKQSNELEFSLRTGIDISSIQSALAKFDKIDFSNIEEYENKVLRFIDGVSQEDMSLIDQAKYAKLQSSYEQLLRGAASVIAGAQKVGATAVGKSGNTSKTTAVALSMSGVSLLLAGFMLAAKKRKDEGQDAAVASAKKVNVRRAGKVAVTVVAVALICLLVLAACDPTDNKGFGKEDLYEIASYEAAEGNSPSRDLTVEVKSSNVTLYKYANGVETVYSKLEGVQNMAFGTDGIGLEFDDLYFTDAQFTVDGDTATFEADVRETLAFLGISGASNGKVSVKVNVSSRSLNLLNVSYDVVSGGTVYNVSIAVASK